MLLLLLLINFAFSLETYNMLFFAKINNNQIILDDYDNNTIIIKYEDIYDNNNFKEKIDFNNQYHKLFKISYDMIYDVYDYKNNYLNISLKMKNITFEENLVLSLSFNNPINYNGRNVLEIKNYIITFSENVLVDNYKNKIQIERFGNWFYLHFPVFKNDLYYNFIIRMDYD
jgi:hypothetical protein